MNIHTNIQNQYQQWHLTQSFDTICGLRTSFYGPKKHDTAKKTVLLIHGLGGDYHGMVPLGYEIRLRFNVYIVELPGHGHTDIPSARTYEFWLRWSQALLPALKSRKITVDTIVAHSFGCMVGAAVMQKFDVQSVFMNPVPRTTVQYRTYSQVMHSLRYIIAPWYGLYPLAVWRGLILSNHKTRQSFDALDWISHRTKYVARQLRYQLEVAVQFKDIYLFSGLSDVSIRKLHIIMGSHDTFSTEDYYDLKRDIPHATLTLLPGGHLLPIESPYQTASEVFKS